MKIYDSLSCTQVRASLVSKSGRYLLNVTKPNAYSGALTLKVFDLASIPHNCVLCIGQSDSQSNGFVSQLRYSGTKLSPWV